MDVNVTNCVQCENGGSCKNTAIVIMDENMAVVFARIRNRSSHLIIRDVTQRSLPPFRTVTHKISWTTEAYTRITTWLIQTWITNCTSFTDPSRGTSAPMFK
jgi:hypothetical protein